MVFPVQRFSKFSSWLLLAVVVCDVSLFSCDYVCLVGVYLSVSLCVRLSLCLFVCRYVGMSPSGYVFVCVCKSVCLSVWLSVFPSTTSQESQLYNTTPTFNTSFNTTHNCHSPPNIISHTSTSLSTTLQRSIPLTTTSQYHHMTPPLQSLSTSQNTTPL